MLYNGFVQLFFLLVLYYNNSIIFIKFTSYSLFTNFIPISTSDSTLLLYILSSSVLTICVLLNILIFFLKKKNYNMCKIYVLVLFIFMNYFIEIQKNCCYIWAYLYALPVNLNLQNGFLNIHPIIIYYLYGLCMWLWIYNHFNKYIYIFIYTKLIIINMLKLAIFGIILGSLWAAQELNWGGFWSWDPVELSSLIILFYLVTFTHKINSFYKNTTKILIIFLVIFIIYCLVRVGIINTIHSFIKASLIPTYIYIIIVYIFYCINMFWIKYIKMNNKNKLQFNTNTTINNLYVVYLWFITVLNTSLIYYLIYILITNSLIKTNVLNISAHKSYYNAIIIFIYVANLKKFKKIQFSIKYALLLACLFLLDLNSSLIICVLLLYIYTYKVKIIHFLFFYFFIFNHYFLIMLHPYVSYFALTWTKNISLTNNIYFNLIDFNYEICSYLKKYTVILNFKNGYNHTHNFNIHTNLINSSFIILKTSKIYNLFNYELVLLLIYIYLNILISVNMQKYTNYFLYKKTI